MGTLGHEADAGGRSERRGEERGEQRQAHQGSRASVETVAEAKGERSKTLDECNVWAEMGH